MTIVIALCHHHVKVPPMLALEDDYEDNYENQILTSDKLATTLPVLLAQIKAEKWFIKFKK